MVKVFVRHCCPLHGRHGSEKAMWMLCAFLGAPGCEAIDLFMQPEALHSEVSPIVFNQTLCGGHIAANRIVTYYSRFGHPSEDVPHQGPRWIVQPRRHIHPCGAMCEHLCRVHLSPLPFSIWAQPPQSLLDLVYGCSFEKSFHRFLQARHLRCQHDDEALRVLDNLVPIKIKLNSLDSYCVLAQSGEMGENQPSGKDVS